MANNGSFIDIGNAYSPSVAFRQSIGVAHQEAAASIRAVDELLAPGRAPLGQDARGAAGSAHGASGWAAAAAGALTPARDGTFPGSMPVTTPAGRVVQSMAMTAGKARLGMTGAIDRAGDAARHAMLGAELLRQAATIAGKSQPLDLTAVRDARGHLITAAELITQAAIRAAVRLPGATT